MIPFILKTEGRDKVKYTLISLTVLLYLYRAVIPWFKYPFFLIYFFLIICCFIEQKERIKSILKEFFINYSIILTLTLILFISFYFSNKIYLITFKDVINSLVLLSVFFMLNIIIRTKKELNIFVVNLITFITFFAVIISIIKMGDLLNIFGDVNTPNISNSYLDQDNNFGFLPIILGIIGLYYLYLHTQSSSRKVFYEVLLTFFTITIFFSGSRRCVIMLILLLSLFFLLQLIKLFKRDIYSLSGSLRLLLFIIFSFVFLFLISLTPYSIKNKAIKVMGSKNVALTKEDIAAVLFKYHSVFDNKKTFLDIYYNIWDVVPDDPDSGWGTRKHNTIFPLTGENAGIVPSNSKGYMMDSSCNANNFNGNAYSFTHIASKNVKNQDTIKASVFCYVSEDFNGEWIALSSEGAVYGNSIKFYNLEKKGEWQKLDLVVSCNEGNAAVFLYFSKYGVSDFTLLKGYVIYAYPQVEVFRNGKILSNIYNERKVLHADDNSYGSDPNRRLMSDQELITSGVFAESTTVSTKYNPLGTIINMSTISLNFDLVSQSRKYLSETNYSFNPFSISMVAQYDQDPIRKWTSRLVSEDTAYYPYKCKISIDPAWNRYGDDRLVRWIFAMQIFSKEYTFKQKLFGGGFAHLNWYGYYFLKDKTASDWPHNPFLSILLYSGIFGLLIYCFFFYKVFYYYIKYIKEYPLLFIFFLITFFFSFFSGGSPFDPPIMGFFSILPFFIHAVHKKEEAELKKKDA